ncbi:hypothetical protein C457_13524 [Haloferax prahovense DSM 18310]|uniref:SHOCT domain-containing protein n=1 Tax=Haloferax prahovense (strain DSM 18310 / JCM 13924 / TL6) TaxID=1227461 RepID=M0G4G2_HALPT|nr:PH domain-containing protein [Haloferax prahovense]ELZ67060.1 hypothetical protein C457_13524 [Haloferax prahovense DSM 18310]
MGILGSSKPDGPAEELAAAANGDSVTSKRLTTTSGSMLGLDHLSKQPLIDLLHDGEQPHYYFYIPNKGLTKGSENVGGGMSSDYRTICLITDERILLITNGNQGEALNYGAVEDTETNKGLSKQRLSIFTNEAEYIVYIAGKTDYDEVLAASEYVLEKAAEAGNSSVDTTVISGLQQVWDPTDESISTDEALDVNPQGGYVTKERFKKIRDILDSDEKVHYITRGSTVDVEGSGAGNSLWGDDRSRKSGTKGWVRAAITDRRVAIKVPQILGSDERSIPYSNITSVDLDTGLVNKRLTLQTAGQTYHIEAHEPGKDEVRDAVRFIRQKISEANQPQVIQNTESSEPDPLDQLKKLKELHDEGILSDDEFEEKKATLLEKV